jgi:hypothetical protein
MYAFWAFRGAKWHRMAYSVGNDTLNLVDWIGLS